MAYSLTYSYDLSSQSYSVTGYSGITTSDKVIIPDKYDDGTNGEHPVTSIGDSAFYNCSSLTSVVIPDSVTSIGSETFSGCIYLTQLITFPSTPPTLGSWAIPTTISAIYVPQSSKEAYKTATDWIEFADKIVSDNLYLSFIRFNRKNKEYIDKKIQDNDIASLNVVDGTAADNQVELQITKQGAGGTIGGPAIVGKDGIIIDKAADSEKIEISGSGCVQKINNSSLYAQVVTIEPNSNTYTTKPISIDALASTIPQRQVNGELLALVSNVPLDFTLINKKYVDDNYVKKVKFTNLEQALYGYILDTTKETYTDLDSAVLKDNVAVGNNVYPIADKTRALVTRIEGKTTKMVQLLDKSTFPATQTKTGVTFTNNGDGTITVNGTATKITNLIIGNVALEANHKYLLKDEAGKSRPTYQSWVKRPNGIILLQTTSDNKYTIATCSADESVTIFIRVEKDATVNNVKFYPNLFDLTAMNREDITTVEQFKAEFPDLYPYENGNIYPAKISGVKFTGKNLFNPSTPKYSGESRFELDGNNITVKQSRIGTYLSANFELPNAKFLIGKKISISAKAKTSDNNQGRIRVLWMRGSGAANISGMDIISNTATGKTETNLSGSGIVLAPPDDAVKLCLLLYSNTEGNLSETKTYTATYSNIQVEISDAPTPYEPYTEPVSVTIPETYDLNGIGDYKDYLEITKNEDNELYTLKKVQNVGVYEYTGNDTWVVGSDNFTSVFGYYCTDIVISKSLGDKGICNKYATLTAMKDKEGVLFGSLNNYIYLFLNKTNFPDINSVKSYLSAQYAENNPVVIYYRLSSPVETVIATNLTYEQVTAIRHNGGLIEVAGNTNKAYARPTVTNTIVYRLTATNTAEG